MHGDEEDARAQPPTPDSEKGHGTTGGSTNNTGAVQLQQMQHCIDYISNKAKDATPRAVVRSILIPGESGPIPVMVSAGTVGSHLSDRALGKELKDATILGDQIIPGVDPHDFSQRRAIQLDKLLDYLNQPHTLDSGSSPSGTPSAPMGAARLTEIPLSRGGPSGLVWRNSVTLQRVVHPQSITPA